MVRIVPDLLTTFLAANMNRFVSSGGRPDYKSGCDYWG